MHKKKRLKHFKVINILNIFHPGFFFLLKMRILYFKYNKIKYPSKYFRICIQNLYKNHIAVKGLRFQRFFKRAFLLPAIIKFILQRNVSYSLYSKAKLKLKLFPKSFIYKPKLIFCKIKFLKRDLYFVKNPRIGWLNLRQDICQLKLIPNMYYKELNLNFFTLKFKYIKNLKYLTHFKKKVYNKRFLFKMGSSKGQNRKIHSPFNAPYTQTLISLTNSIYIFLLDWHFYYKGNEVYLSTKFKTFSKKRSTSRLIQALRNFTFKNTKLNAYF